MLFEERRKKIAARYAEIKHLKADFEWTRKPNYAQFEYVAIALTPAAEELSAEDVALLADSGNLCFGGRGFSKNGKRYSGVVYTD